MLTRIAQINKIEISEIFTPDKSTFIELPLFLESVSAGFPSPADDYLENKLDLNDLLIRNPSSTFYVRVTGNSMINAGIYSGDILVVDRSLQAKDSNIVIAVINGELTVKRLQILKDKIFLQPENSRYKPIEIKEEMNFEVWGVVSTVIHSVI
ncbi:MAG: translesion error-prone DNA polymerase V autoproteolytic subunit [Candidatus Kapabacteria bacterium]|nr:translesion error-prone DNA polymerase V autoproteolytic subunit [Candidatus Kapabacteria bacterium]